MKKKIKYQWTKDCQDVFNDLKKQLVSDKVVIQHFTSKYPIIVAADASEYGMGGVLMLKIPNGERVVQYVFRNLTEREQKYGMTDKEGLVISFTITKLHRYLYGHHFTL